MRSRIGGETSSIHVIAIETALLLSTLAFVAWVARTAHGAAMQVYSGVIDGVRLSRQTRRLILIYVYTANMTMGFIAAALVGLVLVQIGGTASSPEAANTAYLCALVLFLWAIYCLVGASIVVLSLTKMIDRGLRGEPA